MKPKPFTAASSSTDSPGLPPAEGSVLLHHAGTGQWLHFADPVRIVAADNTQNVLACLEEIENAVQREGLHAAGYVAYEAAPAFDSALRVHENGAFPLLWFGLYGPPRPTPLPAPPTGLPPLDWESSVTRDTYRRAIAFIKDAISRGDTYQVNYTLRLRANSPDTPWERFLAMIDQARPAYGAYLQLPRWTICCASPECFFDRQDGRITSHPMKGTAPRGRWSEEDRTMAASLSASPKDRAENIMIVDMVRSDLGRIAETGTVEVDSLCGLEAYPSLFQMTSRVSARTTASLTDTFRALFPPASITGAPKCRTMEIIADLETAPRRVYTGAIGFVAPDGRAQFNVAIRTLLLDRRTGNAEYGVGGGIVWDSDPEGEDEEWRTKARILETPPPDFALLETLRWEPGTGYTLLARHLRRLADSAAYFHFPASLDNVRKALQSCAAALPPQTHRVRLLVSADGSCRCEAFLLAEERLPWRVALAKHPVDPSDRFLYHKTTLRRVYDEAKAAFPDLDDVILYNSRGEITESTRANVVADVNGVPVTPPVSCGLLGGTLRAERLARGDIREGILTVEVFLRSPKRRLINSVRGDIEITFVHPPEEVLP